MSFVFILTEVSKLERENNYNFSLRTTVRRLYIGQSH